MRTRGSRRGRPRALAIPRPRKIPRTERAMAAYDAMVVAAERVLASHGVGGLTTNRVAQVAGVSIGSLYQYFPNKEAIAAALIERYVSRFVGAATALMAEKPTATPMEIVSAVGAAVAALFRVGLPIHPHLRELRAAAGQLEPLDRALDDLVGLVAAYLRSRPEISVEDPDLAAFMIVHAVDGAVNAFAIRHQALDAPLDDPDTIGRELARMLVAYLQLRA